jgi:Sulfotransferase domain
VIDEATRQALKYVKVSRSDVDLRYFPDFLIVGPQRTGTTWLHAHLRYHPEIMLAEPKELYFFSSLKARDNKRFQSDELDWYLRFFHEPLWRVLGRHALSLWRYRRLYRPKVRGEATASYAGIDRDVIGDVTTLKPDIKVILMIRNPLDRAWSHAKKDLVRNPGRKFKDVLPEEFERFFADPYQRRCARYVEQIDNWSAYLQPGHLLVALFDDIDNRPEALLLEVMSFLGVRSDPGYVSEEVREPVNPTASGEIPERYRRFLEDLLKEDIVRLEQQLGLTWRAQRATVKFERHTESGASDTRRRFIFALHQHRV